MKCLRIDWSSFFPHFWVVLGYNQSDGTAEILPYAQQRVFDLSSVQFHRCCVLQYLLVHFRYLTPAVFGFHYFCCILCLFTFRMFLRYWRLSVMYFTVCKYMFPFHKSGKLVMKYRGPFLPFMDCFLSAFR